MIGREWLSRPLHHVMIAAFPMLYLLGNNIGEVDPREAIVPIAMAVVAASALFILLRLARLSARRAALVVSIVAVIVLMFGHAGAAAQQVGWSGTPVLVGWLILGGGLIAIAILAPGDLRSLTMVLNVGAVVLVLPSLVAIGGHLMSERELFVGGQRLDVGVSSPRPSDGSPSGTRPRDIYYFILDGYGAPRAVDQYLDVPDGGFMDWLEASGFTVLRETRSNYARTPLSLASSLNMTYLDELAADMGKENANEGPLRTMIKDPEAVHFLKERGYSYVVLGSQLNLTATSPLADVNPTFAQTSDFIGVLVESTILPSAATVAGLEDDLTDRRRIYDAAMWQLETFPELIDLPGPKFVFTHLFLPHEPWVVDEDGGYVTAEADAERAPAEKYRAQWAFVEREMQQLIERLLAGPDETDPIIIVTPDHGPRTPGMRQIGPNADWAGASDAELDLVFAIASAYHLPGVDQSCVYPGMSSVNAFRLVFDLYFDAGLPLLPDRSYIHRDREHQYDLTDVTDRLPSSGAGSETETTCDG